MDRVVGGIMALVLAWPALVADDPATGQGLRDLGPRARAERGAGPGVPEPVLRDGPDGGEVLARGPGKESPPGGAGRGLPDAGPGPEPAGQHRPRYEEEAGLAEGVP